MKVLVAGVGNVFLSDDGFGVEVARRLARCALPDGVDVGDFGIRGIHLAYELSGYDTTILVDAAPRGGPPGTLYALELEEGEPGTVLDAHGMTPDTVLNLVSLVSGGEPGAAGRVLLVGCEPAGVEPGMELSEAVSAAVGPAVELVRKLIEEELDVETPDPAGAAGRPGGPGGAVAAGHQAVSEDPGDVTPAERSGRA
ncbi:hydrogenase maturation protease [Actinomadura xylanilytica]|uniref:hydrogenase maturation protease n=1 Tax=Actinomadura xylanilytica TaxID=887459 RepID=UPI00255AD7CD|nr:hydrogenase maturation protease [Actinomadura xylanilytica]MDL4774321.1 hydrogenase maturation protease [Actinomadura xylanilytica]